MKRKERGNRYHYHILIFGTIIMLKQWKIRNEENVKYYIYIFVLLLWLCNSLLYSKSQYNTHVISEQTFIHVKCKFVKIRGLFQMIICFFSYMWKESTTTTLYYNVSIVGWWDKWTILPASLTYNGAHPIKYPHFFIILLGNNSYVSFVSLNIWLLDGWCTPWP